MHSALRSCLLPPNVRCSIQTPILFAWTEEQMSELRRRLDKLAGDWLVTVNDSPFTRDLFANFAVMPVRSASGAVNRAKRPSQTFGELLSRR